MHSVSVILPVYNAEKYLPATLDSLLAQTFRDFEIVAVNDESTDMSLQILERYAAKDDRIRIISQPNGGQSGARNTGLKNAVGDFFVFCDNDDLIHPKAFETLVFVQKETNADLVCHGYKRIACDTVLNDISVSEKIGKIHTTTSFDTILSKQINIMPWSKLYRRDLFDGVEFPPVKLGEDFYSTFKTFSRSRKTAYTDNRFYFHRQYPAQTSGNISAQKISDIFKVAKMLSDELTFPRKSDRKAFARYAARIQLFSAILTPVFKTENNKLLDLFCNEWKNLEQNTYVSTHDLTIGRRFVLNALLAGNYETARKRFDFFKKIRI